MNRALAYNAPAFALRFSLGVALDVRPLPRRMGAAGRFRVLAVIAAGGQGAVYGAVCEKGGFGKVAVGTVVVLTAMSVADHDGENFLRLQKRTAELMALAHPGGARYFGCFCEPGLFGDMHVLVTEWLEGETLKGKLRRTPQGLDADEVLRIGEQQARKLNFVLPMTD